MHKFKKLFNYYLSAYWNNPRTLSSMYSFLKLFFERNNKVDSTVASFGNVFRNSKWSNLQVQNIKKSFMKQWLSFFVLAVLFSIFVFTYSSVFSHATTLNFFYAKQVLNDVITNIYYVIGCCIYQVYLYICRAFTRNYEQTALNAFDFKNKNTNLIAQSPSLPNPGSSTTNLNLFWLQKTTNTLSILTNRTKLQPHSQVTRTLQTLNNSFSTSIYFCTLASNPIKLHPLKPDTFEPIFVLGTSLHPSYNQTLNTTQTLNELYSDADFDHDPMIPELVPSSLNNIAKQQRWLTRNFWSNQNVVSNSNSITEAKNFIQNPLTNSSATDANIWLSNKLNNFETEKSALLFQKLKTNYDLISMFNFFENSRFFVNQRYTYLNQLPNQSITSSAQVKNILSFANPTNTINLKLPLTQTNLLLNFNFNTNLYHPSSNINCYTSSAKDILNAPSNLNVFTTNTVNDFLQNTDLQSLNTINTATASSSALRLNVNVSSTSYKI